jgi:predicted RNA-binding Zn ribbon-like protein
MDDLWIEFVNSEVHDHRGREDQDRLADPDWLAGFLRKRGLPTLDGRQQAVRTALGELRRLLLGMVRDLVDDKPLRSANLESLNRHLSARPVTTRLQVQDDDVRLQLIAGGSGLGAVLFAIAESFAKFLVEGEPVRLKACQNPSCRWVFYDTTRSRTKRWCSDTCGNLIKVRKFRAQKSTGRRRRKSGTRPSSAPDR